MGRCLDASTRHLLRIDRGKNPSKRKRSIGFGRRRVWVLKKIGTLGLETKEQVKEQSHQRNAKHATFLSGLVDRKSKHATLCFLRRAHVLILCLQIPSMSTGNFCLVPFAFVWSRLVPFDSVWLRLGVSVRISGKRSPIMAVVASGNKLYLNKKNAPLSEQARMVIAKRIKKWRKQKRL